MSLGAPHTGSDREMGDLADLLLDARRMTLALVADLADDQLTVPYLTTVNPFLWELGHLAWFQEWWMLRHVHGQAPLRGDGDALYDSARVAHATRWHLPLPSRNGTLDYMNRVLDRALASLKHPKRETAYFARLALFHEDMHCEALAYTRQTLGYQAPHAPNRHAANAEDLSASQISGDVSISAGEFLLGASPDRTFVF